jgi:ribonuclease P protein component
MLADGNEGRFGVTASRRVGGAVVRTRCKRRLRELYRTHRHEIEGATIDIVVNAHRSTALVPWAELEQDFLDCIRRGRQKVARTQKRQLQAQPE